jgi:hypothetical protein
MGDTRVHCGDSEAGEGAQVNDAEAIHHEGAKRAQDRSANVLHEHALSCLRGDELEVLTHDVADMNRLVRHVLQYGVVIYTVMDMYGNRQRRYPLMP